MAQPIALVIFLGSILGIVFILYKKIPVLVELPEVKEIPQTEEGLGLKLKEKVKEIFSEKKILQKILSKIRILTLKTEKQIDNLLQRLRKKSQENQKENSIDKNLPM